MHQQDGITEVGKMDFCPHCGTGRINSHPYGSPKGFQKISRYTWRYICFKCGYEVMIKPIKHVDPKELQY